VYRYDGRGALADLRIHEPPPGGFDQRTILTEEELKVEQLCDEERYRSLYNNDVEESTYHGNASFFLRILQLYFIKRECFNREHVFCRRGNKTITPSIRF
jgi:hypothetical protein